MALELYFLHDLELWIPGEHHHHDDAQGTCQAPARGRACSSGSLPAQFFSVLCSVFFNKSYLRPGQWSGVVLVFAGLGA